ncbi:hypothetical protein SDJN03_10255, partial [Cucurbita argyrosperma subsp. sororia]
MAVSNVKPFFLQPPSTTDPVYVPPPSTGAWKQDEKPREFSIKPAVHDQPIPALSLEGSDGPELDQREMCNLYLRKFLQSPASSKVNNNGKALAQVQDLQPSSEGMNPTLCSPSCPVLQFDAL